MKKETILQKLKELKPKYQKEGFCIEALFGSYAKDTATPKSDIDILVEIKPQFVSKYKMKSIQRIDEIKNELKEIFHTDIDIADKTGMGKTAKKFIIDRAIYV
jgi:predicted nucleotidyltransferase